MDYDWNSNPWVWVLTFERATRRMADGHRERPILFRGELVRAILEGRKSQTRRPLKAEPFTIDALDRWGVGDLKLGIDGYGGMSYYDEIGGCTSIPLRCPYGRPGDRLWAKETHGFVSEHGHDRAMEDARAGMPWAGVIYRADAWNKDEPERWRPSIHMPRWASRLALKIVAVRVERLQQISENDALAEGVEPVQLERRVYPSSQAATAIDYSYREGFARKWREIYGEGASS